MRPATVMRAATQRPTTLRHRAALFRDAVSIMEAEYGSQLSLNEIAHRIACSRRQLQRAFAEIGETTFRDHLTAIRMQRAVELLTTSKLTIGAVAQRVGYRYAPQFSKAFRRHHGVSPSVFRGVPRLRERAAVM